MTKGKIAPPAVRPWAWYKSFTRLIDDTRFLLLSVDEQRHYMLIYCCKALGIIDRHEHDKEQLMQMLALKLRVQKNVLELAVMHMWEVGLLHHNTLQPSDWDAEQVEPATSGAARVAKHRATKRAGEPKAQPIALFWPHCISHGDAQVIKPMLQKLRQLERDGEPIAQLILDEIAGFAEGNHIESYPRLAIRLIGQAANDEFRPEYGKHISADRRRRGGFSQLQIGSFDTPLHVTLRGVTCNGEVDVDTDRD